jgi:hypothetical protein
MDDAAVLDQALELGVLREEEGEDGRLRVSHDGGHAERVADREALGGDPALARREVRLLGCAEIRVAVTHNTSSPKFALACCAMR